MSAPLDLRQVLPDGWRLEIHPALVGDAPIGMQYCLDTGCAYARRYAFRFVIPSHVPLEERSAAEAWWLGRAVGAIYTHMREVGESVDG